MTKAMELCEVHSFSTSAYLIYVNALPCKTLMLQIVTLCCDYQYQTAHLFIINLTEAFNNFLY